MTEEVVISQEKFLESNFKTDHLDSFLEQFLTNADYSEANFYCHSWGELYWTSLTKLTSDVNIEEESLIAQRVISDAMNSADADADSFPITKEIRQSCQKARQRQKLAQKSKKSDV